MTADKLTATRDRLIRARDAMGDDPMFAMEVVGLDQRITCLDRVIEAVNDMGENA